MPWLSIIMALLAFFTSKKNGASSTKAALVAGLAGAGSYYVTHETDWGRANLGSLDGVASSSAGLGSPVAKDGAAVKDPSTGRDLVSATDRSGASKADGTGVFDVLKSWGATGTATVLGTAAVATKPGLQKYVPWIIAAGVALLVLK